MIHFKIVYQNFSISLSWVAPPKIMTIYKIDYLFYFIFKNPIAYSFCFNFS